MSSASEPRPYPFTNDVGHVYDTPEKPPLDEESQTSGPSAQDHSPISPMSPDSYQSQAMVAIPPNHSNPTTTLTSSSMSTTSLGTQPPPFNAHAPNHAFTFPNESVRKLNFERFTIPTKNESLSSGFPYDPRVYSLISHDEWHLLSSDIVNASKLTLSEDFAAWTTGVTTGTLSSGLILVFGPVAGYYAGRAVHRKTVVKTVKERLDRDGDIRSVLRRWNEQKFTARGFQAWLELPVDGGEIKLDTATAQEEKSKKEKKAEKKIAKKIARRFRIAIIPNSETMEQAPSYTGPWSPGSPVSGNVRPMAVVEAPGREHMDPVELRHERDPVELQQDRDPVELQHADPEKAPTDGTNSTPVRVGSEISSKNLAGSSTGTQYVKGGEDIENRVELE